MSNKQLNQFDCACIAYASKIRSPRKRAYALAYSKFRRVAEGVQYPDNEDKQISYMAGQAIRMTIEDLWRTYCVPEQDDPCVSCLNEGR